MLDNYYIGHNYQLSYDEDNLGNRPFAPTINSNKLKTGDLFRQSPNESDAGYQKWEKTIMKFFEIFKYSAEYLGAPAAGQTNAAHDLLVKAQAAGFTNADGSAINIGSADPFGQSSTDAAGLASRVMFGTNGLYNLIGKHMGSNGKYIDNNNNDVLDLAALLFPTNNNYSAEAKNGMVFGNANYDIYRDINFMFSNYKAPNDPNNIYNNMFSNVNGQLFYNSTTGQGQIDMGMSSDIFFNNFITPDISGITYGDQNATRLLNFTMKILNSAALVYSGFIDIIGRLNYGNPAGNAANDAIINSWSADANNGVIDKFHLAVLSQLTTATRPFADFLKQMADPNGTIMLGSVTLNTAIKNSIQTRLKDYVKYIYNRQADLINANNLSPDVPAGARNIVYTGTGVLSDITSNPYSISGRMAQIQTITLDYDIDYQEQLSGTRNVPFGPLDKKGNQRYRTEPFTYWVTRTRHVHKSYDQITSGGSSFLVNLNSQLNGLNNDANFIAAKNQINTFEGLAGQLNINNLDLSNLETKYLAPWSEYGILDNDPSINAINVSNNTNSISSIINNNYSDNATALNPAWTSWNNIADHNKSGFFNMKVWNDISVTSDWNKYMVSNRSYSRAERKASEKEDRKREEVNQILEAKRAQRIAVLKEMEFKQIARFNELKNMVSKSSSKRQSENRPAPAKKK